MGKRLFITGGTGFLGTALLRIASGRDYTLGASYGRQTPPPHTAVTWSALDLRDPEAIATVLRQFQPDLVIHTAFVQYEPDLMAITALGSGHVAQVSANLGARLIHMSSDVIFDGERTDAYTEADAPTPINAYGQAKAEAEHLVATAHPGAVIVRTSLIYGFDPIDRQSQFALDIAAGIRNDRLFSDEYRCPIFVDDLANALLELLEQDYVGILNVAGAERVNRYELGTLIVAALGHDPSGIQSARSADLAIRRPRNCALDMTRAQALLRTPLRGLREVIGVQKLNQDRSV